MFSVIAWSIEKGIAQFVLFLLALAMLFAFFAIVIAHWQYFLSGAIILLTTYVFFPPALSLLLVQHKWKIMLSIGLIVGFIWRFRSQAVRLFKRSQSHFIESLARVKLLLTMLACLVVALFIVRKLQSSDDEVVAALAQRGAN
jgi:hypothetical protein